MADGKVLDVVVPGRTGDKVLGRALAIARQVASASQSLPEDVNAGAEHARGLWSRQGFGACNAQEILLAREIIRIENSVYEGKKTGQYPDTLDDVDVMLGNAEQGLPGDDLLKVALFEMLRAGLQRNNIIYLPFHQTDFHEVYVVGKLLERSEEVIPRAMRDAVLPLPSFEVRYVGTEYVP